MIELILESLFSLILFGIGFYAGKLKAANVILDEELALDLHKIEATMQQVIEKGDFIIDQQVVDRKRLDNMWKRLDLHIEQIMSVNTRYGEFERRLAAQEKITEPWHERDPK